MGEKKQIRETKKTKSNGEEEAKSLKETYQWHEDDNGSRKKHKEEKENEAPKDKEIWKCN